MRPSRLTQKDVANAAKVSRTTVALVLKNHPSIPETTREHVRRVIKKLGYSPDPMLSALAAYRHQRRPAAFQGTIAWLVNSVGDYNWRNIEIYREYFEGAKQRVKLYGYSLEAFELQSKGMTSSRMASVFRARNIPGILLCPQPRPNMRLDFPWDWFSCVTFGYTLAVPQLHTVTATQYRGSLKAMRHLRAQGCRRIGYTVPPFHDERTDGNYLAGYLAEEFLVNGKITIPPYVVRRENLPGTAMAESRHDPEPFGKWFQKYRPDAIVTPDFHILEVLDTCGIKTPDDVAVACTSLPVDSGGLSGIFENSALIGEAAVDFLVSMIQRGERGVPQTPQRLLVEGDWVEGRTVRSAPLLPA